MSEQHKFRYLLPPGNNFQFVSKFRTWLILSIFLLGGAIATLFINKSVRGDYMNWTIDFKGGTEIHLAFKKGDAFTKVEVGTVRSALEKAGEEADVSDISWQDANDTKVEGMVIRSPKFSAISEVVKDKAKAAFDKHFEKREITRSSWSGDRFNVRSKQPIKDTEAREFFATIDNEGKKLESKLWSETEREQYTAPDATTKELNQWYGIWGIDRQFATILEAALGEGTKVHVEQSYGVGSKAGAKLRDDAIKSLIYAIFLIMLYLAFRFDIRYAPGAAFATIHDAIMVIGVFAVTWTEVSLTSVAGLLTVVGFSVNDTVVIFDRIRENQAKLKDKSVERIVDISLNEVLVRSILTSATVFSTTLIMNIFGTGDVQNFAFAMNVGVIVGAYSSLFLAAPFYLFISRKWYSGPAPARRRGDAGVETKPAKADKADDEEEE
jgi:preprotein translocase subunit SecF